MFVLSLCPFGPLFYPFLGHRKIAPLKLALNHLLKALIELPTWLDKTHIESNCHFDYDKQLFHGSR